MAEDTRETRQSIIDACLRLNEKGINQGTSGNVSVRVEGGFLITPSGIPYHRMRPEMIVRVGDDGSPEASGSLKPSSETPFHGALMRARPDIGAVVHTHAPHATAVAMQRRAIPACHYMVAVFGGNEVPLVDYRLFGGDALAGLVTKAMRERHGCLMANHGAVVVGKTLDQALWRMEELEALARMFLLSSIGGAPVILGDDEMAEVHAAFGDYGQKDPDSAG